MRTQWAECVRMLSCPGKSTWPVIISARIQAADQTSTVREVGREDFNDKDAILCILKYSAIFLTNWKLLFVWKEGNIPTCLTVVHPVEYDLRCSVPARHNITRHFTLCLSCQAKIQDLRIVTVRFTTWKLKWWPFWP